MINFTVGPVQSCDEVKKIGSENVPYFRTPEFSEIMLENERLMKEFANAPEDARVVFLTGSGTASMEAAVFNSFTADDKVLVINGGSFGTRFVEICKIHDIPFTEIKLAHGQTLKEENLAPFENQGYTGFLVNLCETSTGVLYDLEMIGDFCRRNGIYLIVDAVSAFLADEIDMKKHGIQMLLTGSQKALACPPGISVIVMTAEAAERVQSRDVKCLYLNLKIALKNMERGQTPFTPAVSVLLQINARLKQIESRGGVEAEHRRIAALTNYFRSRVASLPFDFFASTPSNAVTALATRNCSAYDIFRILKDDYDIWICPNGGELAEKVLRVGHIGELTEMDYSKLLYAFQDLNKKGILI